MIEAELPDGTILEFPAGTSPDVIQRVVKQRLAPVEQKSMLGAIGAGIGQGVGNVALGAQNLLGKGFESIGAERAGQWLQQDAMEGKQRLAQEAAPYAQQFPMAAGGGKLAGEIAGTLPVGGALAKGVAAIPGMAQKAAPLVQALRTGGFSAGGATGAAGMATRAAGGAATGGAATSLIDPNDVKSGAAIGAIAGPALATAGRGLANVLGTTTGVGGDALSMAYKSGKAGGTQSKAFAENMRGEAEIGQVLDDARSNLESIRQARSAAYKQNMSGVAANQNPIDMAPIESAVKDSFGKFTFKGQAKDPQVLKTLESVAEEVTAWKQLNPGEFHTAEGLDALKQRIGAIKESLPFEARSSRAAVDGVYNSIKSEIQKKAPEYAKAMGEYSNASQLIDEVQRALSLGDRASADTAMRKLQSLTRNNVNTNYGNRLALAQELEQQGGKSILPALSGQALSSFTPRGLQAATGSGVSSALALTGNLPQAAIMAGASSPRLMGEAFYGAGQAAGKVNPRLIEALRRGIISGAPVANAQE